MRLIRASSDAGIFACGLPGCIGIGQALSPGRTRVGVIVPTTPAAGRVISQPILRAVPRNPFGNAGTDSRAPATRATTVGPNTSSNTSVNASVTLTVVVV